jgi:hypothetical protein
MNADERRLETGRFDFLFSAFIGGRLNKAQK